MCPCRGWTDFSAREKNYSTQNRGIFGFLQGKFKVYSLPEESLLSMDWTDLIKKMNCWRFIADKKDY
tara:strand:+ start:240 stop:440 length:201 start_codon:yes stop_codon:yes gene_type:complete